MAVQFRPFALPICRRVGWCEHSSKPAVHRWSSRSPSKVTSATCFPRETVQAKVRSPDALDRACLEAVGEMRELCVYLYGLGNGALQRAAVVALTPSALPIKGDLALAASATQLQNVAQRQQALRNGTGSQGLSQLGFDVQGQSVGTGQLASGVSSYEGETADVDRGVDSALSEIRQEAGVADEDEIVLEREELSEDQRVIEEDSGESRLGWFVNGRISIGDHDRTAVEPGYDVSTRGVTAGADWRFAEGYLGGALGYVDSSTDLHGDVGSIDTNGYTLTAYGGLQRGQFFFDGALSYGLLDFDTRRQIVLPIAFNGQTVYTARGVTDSNQVSLSLGAGYDWTLGRVQLEGFGRGLLSRLEIDGFDEVGAGGLAVSMKRQTVDSKLAEAGVEAALPVSYSWGVMNPVARVSYFHEFENDSRRIPGTFGIDATGQEFRLLTDRPDRDYFNLGLGVQFTLRHSRLLYFMLDTDLMRSDFDQYTLTFGYRQQW